MPNNHLMLDYATFDAAKEMMKQKFEKIISYYFEDVQTYIESIKDGLDQKDLEMIVPAAHTIKSSSRQIGAFALANYAANIEEKGRNQVEGKEDFSKLEEVCYDLELMFKATEQEIRKYLQ